MENFITRNEDGKLQQSMSGWEEFVEGLFSMARNSSELQFIGQLVEDLQYRYDEKLDEMEEDEEVEILEFHKRRSRNE